MMIDRLDFLTTPSDESKIRPPAIRIPTSRTLQLIDDRLDFLTTPPDENRLRAPWHMITIKHISPPNFDDDLIDTPPY
jgi:hypothetical protein